MIQIKASQRSLSYCARMGQDSLVRLRVVPSSCQDATESVVSTLLDWLPRHGIEPAHLVDSRGNHELIWTDAVSFNLWPSLLGEYIIHQTVPLCRTPVELSAGLQERLEDTVSIHLPWSEEAPPAGDFPHAGHSLWNEYRVSSLARFHRLYYSDHPHGPEQWETTYDRIQPGSLPACVAVLLKNGGALYHWTALQHLTRSLLGLGWRPRHIAGIIWSHWARDFPGLFTEPLVQADHLVRSCAGFLLGKIDRLRCFDCDFVRAVGLCPPNPCCPVDLATLRQQLLNEAYL